MLRDVFFVNRSVLKAPASERCSPIHLTAVIRHGSRYPTVKNIRRIQKLSELVRKEASRGSEDWQQDIQSRWENWFTEDMDGEPGSRLTTGNKLDRATLLSLHLLYVALLLLSLCSSFAFSLLLLCHSLSCSFSSSLSPVLLSHAAPPPPLHLPFLSGPLPSSLSPCYSFLMLLLFLFVFFRSAGDEGQGGAAPAGEPSVCLVPSAPV